jgi:hypothetical protein
MGRLDAARSGRRVEDEIVLRIDDSIGFKMMIISAASSVPRDPAPRTTWNTGPRDSPVPQPGVHHRCPLRGIVHLRVGRGMETSVTAAACPHDLAPDSPCAAEARRSILGALRAKVLRPMGIKAQCGLQALVLDPWA